MSVGGGDNITSEVAAVFTVMSWADAVGTVISRAPVPSAVVTVTFGSVVEEASSKAAVGCIWATAMAWWCSDVGEERVVGWGGWDVGPLLEQFPSR